MVVIFCNVHSMDFVDITDKKDDKKDNKFLKSSDSNGTTTRNTVQISSSNDEIKLSKNKKLDQNAGSPKGSKFNLDLTNNLNLSKAKSVRTIPKTPKTSVGSHQDLVDQISGAKKTQRELQSSRNSPKEIGSLNLNDISDGPTVLKQRSFLPRVLGDSDLMHDIVQDKNHTDEEVWEIIKCLNPVVYDYAKKNNKDLDFVIVSAQLLNDMNIKPSVLQEFVNKHHNLKGNEVDEDLKQHYKKIKRDNPDYWQTLILEMFEAVDGEENGSKSTALTNINGTHIGLLTDKVKNQESDKFKLWVVIAVKAVVLIGGFAWAIYGQISGTSHPTNAPTNVPTYSPTYGPTFSPTQSPT